MIRTTLATLLLLLGATTLARAGDMEDIAGLRVAVWRPTTAARAPAVIFSHGFHGCATQSGFLMQALADAGYFVFAPEHRDGVCNGPQSGWLSRPEASFFKPDQWTSATYADRRDDLHKLAGALRDDPRFRGALDMRRVALVGHALGGYTALAVAGARPEWRLDGVAAVLALSPSAEPLLRNGDLSRIGVAVMYLGGTRDLGVTPYLKRENGVYERTGAPKYFVEFEGVGHFDFADAREGRHDAIVAWSLAFLDRYLRGRDGRQLTAAREGVAELRYQSEFGAAVKRGENAKGDAPKRLGEMGR
jgi:predicted dienelactone hydrolase